MELKDTVKMMESDDYKERFVAEYLQTEIRMNKLVRFISRILDSIETLGEIPEHDCPLEVLLTQQAIMRRYLMVLAERAKIEGIELPIIE